MTAPTLHHIVDRPVEFPGTDAERFANFATHHFSYTEDECPRCFNCDCRMAGVVASYPCGADVPRETIEVAAFGGQIVEVDA